MKKMLLILLTVALYACQENTEQDQVKSLAAPDGLKIEQTDLTTVQFAWTDNAEGEKGYRVYLRGKSNPTPDQPFAVLDADTETYTYENLVTGELYDFGVQAISEDFNLHSEIVYTNDYKVLNHDELVDQGLIVRMEAPSDLHVEQVGRTSDVTLTWTDNAKNEKGYKVYARKASAETFSKPSAVLDADATTYTFSNLSGGTAYVFGVQSAGETELNDSQIQTIELTLEDYSIFPAVAEIKTSYAYIAVTYSVDKLKGSNPDHGVCFSTSGEPTVEDIRVTGPSISAKTKILQVVPNAYLEADKEYKMRVFVKNGEQYLYSDTQTVRLEAQPELPQLSWEKQTYAEAEGVEIYKTTSQMNGRNFNAWYAIADPSEVDFRVMYPETVGASKTVQAQAEEAGDCLALINGAIFGKYNIGVIITEGKMTQQWQGEIEGCYWGTDKQLYQLTRPIIGVDKEGKATACWVGVPQQGTFYYYDRPQANVVGQAKYPKVTETSPVQSINWNPYFAISCGPMVLYDGKVAADNTMVDDTHYYTNYECWDESGVYSAHPDRSAVGVTADGKIVLFICDGRIDASKGAYMKEIGPIMKSIGCVHAMNLDGGGSTGMWVNGAGMINYMDTSWRAVKSTLGFFKK